MECSEESFSTSAKKFENQEQCDVPKNASTGYRILEFITVFSAISNAVKCKQCNGNVRFETASERGLGFKIVLICDKCIPQYINSSPLVSKAYEINRRFIFIMRILGVGLQGCKKFCGLMDLPPFLAQASYDAIIENIFVSVKTVTEKLFKKAVDEEITETCKARNDTNTRDLTVSGDGTWKKRGFSSLYGVSSLIGYYTGKVIDIVVKGSYCKACEVWEKKLDAEEYNEWSETHASECSANHTGSAGSMEVNAIVEMFRRSEENYGVRYTNYIGDGDSKTYKGIIDNAPYKETIVNKKECVGYVQKRMGTQLRNVKKNSSIVDTKTDKKKRASLGGKGKLTAKQIDKLTVYYGLAIRRNCDSVDEMYKAIWATYWHCSSTDSNPRHENCPPGEESWCAWQRASARGDAFKHDYDALPDDVLDAIKPIYEALSSPALLQRCLGGFTK